MDPFELANSNWPHSKVRALFKLVWLAFTAFEFTSLNSPNMNKFALLHFIHWGFVTWIEKLLFLTLVP